MVAMYYNGDELPFFFLNVKGDRVAKIIRVPKDNVDFKLTIVRGGRTETRTFRLLNFGCCSDRAEAERKADKRGMALAEAKWRMPFQRKFPKPTRLINAIFGGSEWVRPNGHRRVPCLDGDGMAWYADFYLSDGVFYGDCRWLASRKKPRHPGSRGRT